MSSNLRKRVSYPPALAVYVAAILLSSLILIPQPQTAHSQALRIALVTDALFSDGGWGSAAFQAAKQLETKYGYDVAYAESIAIPDIEATLRQYSEEGYDLIIAHGFQWGDPAVKVGKEYPDTKYVVFTGLVASDNVASIFPQQQEGTFLLGALGAMMTDTGTIAYVGGDQYPNLINIFEGYKQGAKHINPEIEIIGTYLGEWDNPAKGKEAGLAQINAGADILFHVADTSGHGVIQAAKERGSYAFGAVGDQNQLAPDTVLTSFVLDIDKAFDQATQMVVEDRFEGKIFKPGIEVGKGAAGDGIVFLAPFHDLADEVSEDVKTRLEQLTRDVLDKKIVVPERFEEAAENYVTAELGGQSYTVSSESNAFMRVSTATINPNESVVVEFTNAGEVELTLPKSMIDGISMVKAGDKELEFETVSSTEGETTIKFTVPEEDKSVEISAATVVPEFGVMAVLVLATLLIAVVGIVRFKGTQMSLGRL
ncbi:MAG: BMP family lipoprotein [Nitrososphaerales archaeon]